MDVVNSRDFFFFLLEQEKLEFDDGNITSGGQFAGVYLMEL